jgi:glutaminyl-tRNA synthetase
VNAVKDPKTGEVVELRCTYDPATRSGFAPDGRKVDATIHWVSADLSIPAEVRLYDRLFKVPNPMQEGTDFTQHLNEKSLEILKQCRVEQSLANAAPGSRFQFERIGYFCTDLKDSSPVMPVFNRIVSLRDSWAKVSEKEKK